MNKREITAVLIYISYIERVLNKDAREGVLIILRAYGLSSSASITCLDGAKLSNSSCNCTRSSSRRSTAMIVYWQRRGKLAYFT